VLGAAAVLVVLAVLAGVLLTRSDEPVVAADATSGVPTSAPSTRPRTSLDDGGTTTTFRRRATTTTAPELLWTPWSPPDRGFTIDFPGTPQVSPVPVDGTVISRASMALTESSTTAYLVGWYDLSSPRYAADSALILNGVADSFGTSFGLQLTSRSLGHWAGNPSLDFAGTRQYQGRTLYMQGMEMLAGVRLFLFLAGDAGDEEADFGHFRDSFRIGG
jgi:hypothetical protein